MSSGSGFHAMWAWEAWGSTVTKKKNQHECVQSGETSRRAKQKSSRPELVPPTMRRRCPAKDRGTRGDFLRIPKYIQAPPNYSLKVHANTGPLGDLDRVRDDTHRRDGGSRSGALDDEGPRRVALGVERDDVVRAGKGRGERVGRGVPFKSRARREISRQFPFAET